MKKMLIVSVFGFGLSLFATGCVLDMDESIEAELDEAEIGTTEQGITVWQNNTVCSSSGLWLRSQNATNGATIGKMPMWSTMYVDRVDWNTGMAYGYSYNLGKSGWARKDYLTTNCTISGGGEG